MDSVKKKAEELCMLYKHIDKEMQTVYALITARELVDVAKRSQTLASATTVNNTTPPYFIQKELSAYVMECEEVVLLLEEMVGESTLEEYLLK